MPGQFGFGLLCDGVVDELPGVILLGVVVLGVVVLGVVAVPVELAAFAIAGRRRPRESRRFPG
jgi:Zn-dependent membrane protease YugP